MPMFLFELSYHEYSCTTQMLIVYISYSINPCLACLDGRSQNDDGFLIAHTLQGVFVHKININGV